MCFKGSGGGPMEIPPNKQVGKNVFFSPVSSEHLFQASV